MRALVTKQLLKLQLVLGGHMNYLHAILSSPRVAASAPAQSHLNGSFVKTIMTKHIYASGNGSRIIFFVLNLVKHEVYPANAKTHGAEAFAAEARGKYC